MNASSKRLFVGNIPPGVTESELSNEFSSYGKVLSVELKVKSDNKSESGQSIFAFVNLEADGWGLKSCINEFSNQKWKGQYLKVALAKESFMEQLKREREEAKQRGEQSTTTGQDKNDINVKPQSTTPKSNSHQSSAVKTTKSSSSSSSESEDEEIKKVEPKPKTSIQKVENSSQFREDKHEENVQFADYVIKNNKHKLLDKGKALKIESVNSNFQNLKPKTIEKVVDPQVQLAEKKRLQSLHEKKVQYNHQKNLLQKALSNIDTKRNNKIIFDEDGLNNTSSDNISKKKGNKRQTENISKDYKQANKKSKYELFDDCAEDDNNQYNFEIKEQFQGKKGQKLLELQSRFTNDERFAMDSRFIDDEIVDEPENNVENDYEDYSDQEERKRQFKILGDVIGKSFDDKKENFLGTSKKMLRFDPSKPEHEKFLIEKKSDLKITDKKKQRHSDKELDSSTIPEQPAVSKETFYKVTTDLKESLQEKSDFSLLKLFGRDNEIDDEDQEQNKYESVDIAKKSARNIMKVQDNPFRYDSSDSEDENEKDVRSSSKNTEDKTTNAGMISKGIFRENFFFNVKDQRILDSVAFFTNCAQENYDDSFGEMRRQMKGIVRNKVLHNKRNTPQFRRKLGGNKQSFRRK